MRMKVVPLLIFILAFVVSTSAQVDRTTYQPVDPMANISIELTNISRSVQQLSDRLKTFVDKFEKVAGLTLTEKQQRFIMGLEILVRSEQRVATLQKAHVELVEKQIQVKARLTQIEQDLKPQNIDRAIQFEGAASHAPEVRENRIQKLVAEQRSLQQLFQQIERNIFEADSSLREAQAHVSRLRRSLLPQIEKEIEGTMN
jgi:hypothetical protein